jgi:5-methylcytosine-specific restriction endonuclease McrA
VENLVAACRKCNKSRGNKPYGVWLKDAYYLKVSKALTADEQSANQDLEKTLDAIPRRVYQPSR